MSELLERAGRVLVEHPPIETTPVEVLRGRMRRRRRQRIALAAIPVFVAGALAIGVTHGLGATRSIAPADTPEATGVSSSVTAGRDTTVVTPTTPTDPIGDGSTICAPGSYTVGAGDIRQTVAQKFDVSVAWLDYANRNTPDYGTFRVGLVITIPGPCADPRPAP